MVSCGLDKRQRRPCESIRSLGDVFQDDGLQGCGNCLRWAHEDGLHLEAIRGGAGEDGVENVVAREDVFGHDLTEDRRDLPTTTTCW